MPIFFNRVKRQNPSDRTAPQLWYPVLKSLGLVKEKEVAKQLADETTLNPKEAEMAIYQLFKVIIRLLLAGHTVQLGDLGTIRLTASSEGSATEEEANATKIKQLNARFIASEDFKTELKKAVIRDASSLQKKTETEP